jgi:hypothetical protein
VARYDIPVLRRAGLVAECERQNDELSGVYFNFESTGGRPGFNVVIALDEMDV